MIRAADDAHLGHAAGTSGTLNGFLDRHPEWWAVLAAAGAWGMMAVPSRPSAAHHGHHGHTASGGSGLLAASVMVIAMMLPLAVSSIRHAARASPERRHRAIAGFLAGYLAVWIAAMVAIAALWTEIASLAGWTAAVAGTVAVAALWEAVPVRKRLAHRCRRPAPRLRRGWSADAECARHGAGSGAACVGTCWALMAACVAFAHSLPVMAALFGVQLAGRYGRRDAPALSALAVLGIGLAAVAAHVAT